VEVRRHRGKATKSCSRKRFFFKTLVCILAFDLIFHPTPLFSACEEFFESSERAPVIQLLQNQREVKLYQNALRDHSYREQSKDWILEDIGNTLKSSHIDDISGWSFVNFVPLDHKKISNKTYRRKYLEIIYRVAVDQAVDWLYQWSAFYGEFDVNELFPENFFRDIPSGLQKKIQHLQAQIEPKDPDAHIWRLNPNFARFQKETVWRVISTATNAGYLHELIETLEFRNKYTPSIFFEEKKKAKEKIIWSQTLKDRFLSNSPFNQILWDPIEWGSKSGEPTRYFYDKIYNDFKEQKLEDALFETILHKLSLVREHHIGEIKAFIQLLQEKKDLNLVWLFKYRNLAINYIDQVVHEQTPGCVHEEIEDFVHEETKLYRKYDRELMNKTGVSTDEIFSADLLSSPDVFFHLGQTVLVSNIPVAFYYLYRGAVWVVGKDPKKLSSKLKLPFRIATRLGSLAYFGADFVMTYNEHQELCRFLSLGAKAGVFLPRLAQEAEEMKMTKIASTLAFGAILVSTSVFGLGGGTKKAARAAAKSSGRGLRVLIANSVKDGSILKKQFRKEFKKQFQSSWKAILGDLRNPIYLQEVRTGVPRTMIFMTLIQFFSRAVIGDDRINVLSGREWYGHLSRFFTNGDFLEDLSTAFLFQVVAKYDSRRTDNLTRVNYMMRLAFTRIFANLGVQRVKYAISSTFSLEDTDASFKIDWDRLMMEAVVMGFGNAYYNRKIYNRDIDRAKALPTKKKVSRARTKAVFKKSMILSGIYGVVSPALHNDPNRFACGVSEELLERMDRNLDDLVEKMSMLDPLDTSEELEQITKIKGITPEDVEELYTLSNLRSTKDELIMYLNEDLRKTIQEMRLILPTLFSIPDFLVEPNQPRG